MNTAQKQEKKKPTNEKNSKHQQNNRTQHNSHTAPPSSQLNTQPPSTSPIQKEPIPTSNHLGICLNSIEANGANPPTTPLKEGEKLVESNTIKETQKSASEFPGEGSANSGRNTPTSRPQTPSPLCWQDESRKEKLFQIPPTQKRERKNMYKWYVFVLLQKMVCSLKRF